jgi:hypothetical protein
VPTDVKKIKLMLEIGVLDRTANEIDVLVTWNILRRDPVLWGPVLAALQANTASNASIFDRIAALSPQEKSALRDRVLDRCEQSVVRNRVKRA